jgi:hypothetical protein
LVAEVFNLYKKFIIFLNILASLSCLALGVKYVGAPLYAQYFYANEYKDTMFKCDYAMKEHLIAKNRVIHEKSLGSVERLKLAELGLIDCHSYDLLRKKMLSWGVSESDLSLLGLEIIEAKSEDVRSFVKTHEFKY